MRNKLNCERKYKPYMRNKLNCCERKDGQNWRDYILNEIQTKGAWYEIRYGDKYFKNKSYSPLCEVDITVGKDPDTAETVLTLMLESKKLIKIKDLPVECINSTLDDLVNELEEMYKKKISKKDKVTLLRLDDDFPCGCPPI
jgi:hypothetical protein